MKILVAQQNPLVGDINGNYEKMLSIIRSAHEEKCADLIVFSECFLTGYPVEDLALEPGFCQSSWTHILRLQEYLRNENSELGIAVGFVYPEFSSGYDSFHRAYNSLAFVTSKHIEVQKKIELPNYGVFDEKRVFYSGSCNDLRIISFKDKKIGFLICEDIWHSKVALVLKEQEADLLICLNASPFEQGKYENRVKTIQERVKEVNLPILYVNQVGGQDELVFDGRSFFIDEKGIVKISLEAFKECIFNIDLNNIKNTVINYQEEELLYLALLVGLKDYVHKAGFKKAVLGVSGGIDSALVACLAAKALGNENVKGLLLPSKNNSYKSLYLSEDQCKKLKISYESICIDSQVEFLKKRMSLSGLALENLQSRVRGTILMSFSNQHNHLLLSTGNKSEISIGYSTLYGDMCGAFNPLKDVYKTEVYKLANYINDKEEKETILNDIILRPPSAELSPGQEDEKELMPYKELDPYLKFLIEKRYVGNFEEKYSKIKDLVYRCEFKRRQACPGIKVSPLSFGRDRRYPIINRWR